jgi:CBS domain-containing protein
MYVLVGAEASIENAATQLESPMSVSLISNPNVATIAASEGIAEAAVLMRQEHVGDLVVVERRGNTQVPIGILTDRDIVVSVVAKRVPAESVTVGDAMTRNLLTVREDSSLEYALREMRRYGVRRAPVVRANGDLVGVIAVDDLVQHLAVQLSRLADLIRVEQDAELATRP